MENQHVINDYIILNFIKTTHKNTKSAKLQYN